MEKFIAGTWQRTHTYPLISADRFEASSAGDQQSGPVERHELAMSEFAQSTGDRFAGDADEFSDLSVSQREFDSSAVFRDHSISGPFKQPTYHLK